MPLATADICLLDMRAHRRETPVSYSCCCCSSAIMCLHFFIVNKPVFSLRVLIGLFTGKAEDRKIFVNLKSEGWNKQGLEKKLVETG